jgi:hypothetical protein
MNNKPKCKDVNRQCEFGEIFEKEDIRPERNWVVDRTIGYDDIGHYEDTGMYAKIVDKVKVCKFCGNTEFIDSKTTTVRKREIYE